MQVPKAPNLELKSFTISKTSQEQEDNGDREAGGKGVEAEEKREKRTYQEKLSENLTLSQVPNVEEEELVKASS
jgi:hypothetical protein